MHPAPIRSPRLERLEPRQLFAVAPGFIEAEFAGGLTQPTAFAFAPDGRLFVAEQGGDLRIIKDAALLPDAAIELDVPSEGERGLLGLAFDPDFTQNGLIYLHFTTRSPVLHNRVSRFSIVGDTIDASSEQVVIDLPSLTAATNHNGGAIHFGPDGKLYIAVGDNNDPSNAQPLTTTLGKMLRLNGDGSIPDDNPFFNQTTGQSQAIWARGLRNPYTFAFRSDGRMHINDVGQSDFEEINVGVAGGNYGWPITEGKRTPDENPPAGYVDPLFAYGRDGGPVSGATIAGGAFYETPAGATTSFPADLEGDYLFADWGAGFVKSIDPATAKVSPVASGLGGPLDLAVGPDGGLYVLEYVRGRVTRISSAPADLSIAIAAEPQAVARKGGRDTVKLQVDNVGQVAVKGRIAIRLHASTDGAVDASDTLVKEVPRNVRLQAGKGRSVKLRFAYPDTLDGTFNILAELSSADGRIAEENLINNVAASTAAVRVAPAFIDLAPTFREPSQTLSAAARRSLVKVEVANLGNVRFVGKIQIDLTLTPQSGGAATPIASVAPRRVIASAGEKPVQVRFALPQGLAAGVYDLSATAVAAGPIADADTANNVALAVVTVS